MTRQETIDEITRRLVDVYRPVRIYLFGSEARGDAGPDSDLDLCVILPDDAPPEFCKAKGVHRNLWACELLSTSSAWRRVILSAGPCTCSVRCLQP